MVGERNKDMLPEGKEGGPGRSSGLFQAVGIGSLFAASFLLGRINEAAGVIIADKSQDGPLLKHAKGMGVAIALGTVASALGYIATYGTWDSIKDSRMVKMANDAIAWFGNFERKDDASIQEKVTEVVENVLPNRDR